jgi:excisionase family DNA binding protein
MVPWYPTVSQRARHWLSTGEVARALGVGRWSVNLWVRQGRLAAQVPAGSRRARIAPEALEALVEARLARKARTLL